MIAQNFNLIRYDADEGKVLIWLNSYVYVPVDETRPMENEQIRNIYTHTYYWK